MLCYVIVGWHRTAPSFKTQICIALLVKYIFCFRHSSQGLPHKSLPSNHHHCSSGSKHHGHQPIFQVPPPNFYPSHSATAGKPPSGSFLWPVHCVVSPVAGALCGISLLYVSQSTLNLQSISVIPVLIC